MKLMIDIPKKTFEEIQERSIITCGETFAQKLVKYIRNGEPLPEKHGRLIDADALYESSRLCHTEEDGTACVEYREINDAPTIIEGSESE